ncbi:MULTISPECIES: amidohydrolase family protein [Bradyrhizobium]|jgi:imidazolonepropionase-like amidohydrolase|uniref:Pro-Hyp dipeptidase. Metallo peptidase. MEROPS family M38 n=2 Tax=Bradyrhizobium TaxID=374 RepID=A0ABY0PC57_9BRAD|nr:MULTISPECIES: amidohydrolase family protein [Bradyrhizobium]SDH47631.1 Pro-Hyp dipeptidase. Metallo peptidase. MEROPS family M38 [Bradyrhizobium ottawaense]SEE29620.1 Pro-Hyp dipeptidase. Metallo peptidase. MEROPS family M38 [Bradyrhizobium lablabi]SHM25994.1 Pro-Hyp dipeptidase. Metallo peptidase. MEROPS family M38 [Bradyrhizobium lablabi]
MIRNLLRAAFFLFVISETWATADAQTLVLTGGTVYASPEAAPLADAVIIATNGVITAIGSRSEVQIPADIRVIDCTGKTIVAGFWNSHVHFTEPVWRNAGAAPAVTLEAHMQEMLTRWGFTSVWDLGSDPDDSLPLRRRVNSGEVPGPNIFFAGNMFPKGGHPVYIPREVPLPEVATPEEAAKLSRDYLAMGLDGIKLFTGAFMGDRPVVNMEPAVARAAVDVAHGQGKPVFAHPQNKTGVDTVIEAGVDVLAHTASSQSGYTPEQLARFKSQGIALIPTLSLFTTVVLDPAVTERVVAAAVGQLKQFSDNGGVVLFGTDIGFIKLYDTSREVELMHRVLGERQVLASLTTNPATYFKATNKGRVEKGFDADLAVLDGDPLADVRNLAKVTYTIRAGQVIYQKP